MISFDYSNSFVRDSELKAFASNAIHARSELVEGTGIGSEFTGWVDLPVRYDRAEFERIKKAAEKIRKESEVLLVIGVGGSYLGPRAVIEALTNSFDHNIIFCGNSFSPKYTRELMDFLRDKDFSINVISKSGTTTEPAVAFRIFKKVLEEKYGKEEAAHRIYATTDRAVGALKTMADNNGYETFVIPDDVGGRYSVLTPVGLLPIAVAGVDIDALMAGAQNARLHCIGDKYEDNVALKYAAVRNILHQKGKAIEIAVNYEPSLHHVLEWWKQLYGESEGKDGKGIYPSSVDFTTDLHSIGQFIQDGSRIMFETVINVEKNDYSLLIDPDEENLDQLNYLAGMEMDHINKSAMRGTVQAHVSGKTPNLILNVERQDAYNFGELFYTFEFACAVSGYILGINPFDQPGVTQYKTNMFTLLGKPGYEKE